MPKLRTYKSFKSGFKTETYVKANVLNTRQRSAIAKMRNGTNPLKYNLEVAVEHHWKIVYANFAEVNLRRRNISCYM